MNKILDLIWRVFSRVHDVCPCCQKEYSSFSKFMYIFFPNYVDHAMSEIRWRDINTSCGLCTDTRKPPSMYLTSDFLKELITVPFTLFLISLLIPYTIVYLIACLFKLIGIIGDLIFVHILALE